MFLTCVEGMHFEFFKSTGTQPTTPEIGFLPLKNGDEIHSLN